MNNDTVYVYGCVEYTRLKSQYEPIEIFNRNERKRKAAQKFGVPFRPADVYRPYTEIYVSKVKFLDWGNLYQGKIVPGDARAELEKFQFV